MFQYVFAFIVILSTVLIVWAYFRKSFAMMVGGAFFSIPLTLYFAAQPALNYLPVATPAIIALAGWLLSKERKWWALLCISPYLVMSAGVIIFGYILDVW
jgi:hypothetical protein